MRLSAGPRPHHRGHRRQRGVAIVTALLVVMLAASIAAFLLAQQSRALTRTARTTERAQAALYAKPALDYVRAGLFRLQQRGAQVDLTQPWAQGFNAIPIDGAIASGALRDEGGLFNLNNLIKDDGTRSDPDVQVFRRLLTALRLNPDLANAAADWIDADDEIGGAGGAENATYMSLANPCRAANQRLLQVDELRRVFGFDDAAVNKLLPFVTALPARTKVNVNTAPAEVLAAALPDLAPDEITALMKRRMSKPFTQTGQAEDGGIQGYLKNVPAATVDALLDYRSRHFRALLAIENGGAQVRQSALLENPASGTPAAATRWPAIIWVKND